MAGRKVNHWLETKREWAGPCGLHASAKFSNSIMEQIDTSDGRGPVQIPMGESGAGLPWTTS